MTRNTTTTTMVIEDFGLSDIDKYERGTIIFTKELLTIMGDISLIIIEKDIENEIKNIRRKLRIKQPSKIEMRECYEKYFGDISKEHFYKRYNWVHQQRQISFTDTKRLSEPTPDLLFDNELELLDHACLNYPFAPVSYLFFLCIAYLNFK